jgi:hypothetical protein
MIFTGITLALALLFRFGYPGDSSGAVEPMFSGDGGAKPGVEAGGCLGWERCCSYSVGVVCWCTLLIGSLADDDDQTGYDDN